MIASEIARRSARIALFAHFGGVLAVFLARLPPWVAVLLALPLLLPLPGLRRQRPYTAAWASLLVTFYIGGTLAEWVAGARQEGDLLVAACAGAICFVCLLAYVRLKVAEVRAEHARKAAGR